MQRSISSQPSPFMVVKNEDIEGSMDGDKVDDYDGIHATPQWVIDSLSHYTVRPNGPYLLPGCVCGICYKKYNVGDKVTCLPCQHNFHDYFIENWLKWVKSTCPVDKKRVARHQYIDDVNNERRERLLEAYGLNNANANSSSSSAEEDGQSFGKEMSAFDDTVGKKSLERKQARRKVQELKSPNECSSKLTSRPGRKWHFEVPVDPHEIDAASNSPDISPKRATERQNQDSESEIKDKSFMGVYLDKYPQQLRESIDAIRRSIRERDGESNAKKQGDAEFEEALEKVIGQLSDSRIETSQVPEDRDKFAASASPSKNAKTGVTVTSQVKNNLKFGDLLKTEGKVISLYDKNNPITSPKDIRMKYNHLLKKKF